MILITNVVHLPRPNTTRAMSERNPPDKSSEPEGTGSPPANSRYSWFTRPAEAWKSIRQNKSNFADRAALRFLIGRSNRENSRYKDYVAAVGLSAWALAGLMALSRLVRLPPLKIDGSGIRISKADVGVQTTSDVDPNWVPPLLCVASVPCEIDWRQCNKAA